MTDDDRMDDMFNDIPLEYESNSEDLMLEKVKGFLELLRASEEPLHEHIIVPTLAFMNRFIAIKSMFTFSSKCYNRIMDHTMMSLHLLACLCLRPVLLCLRAACHDGGATMLHVWCPFL
jgi:hypothetical protein